MADDSPQATAAPAPREQWRIPAEPARVPEVRHGVRAFAAGHGAAPDVLGNLALAVTEAVTNAILHAYIGVEPGEVVVVAQAGADELLVSVADDGRGMQPRPDSPGLGMGLPMIGQLTTSVDIRERVDGGTEVRMRFAAPGVRGPLELAEGDARLQLLVEVARLAQAGGWPQQGVGRLVTLLVPAIADACVLDRVAAGELERLAAEGPEPPPAQVPEEDAQVLVGDGSPIRWWIALPLRDGERPIGLLRLGLAAGRGDPEPHDIVYLETLAERAARGLASVQLIADLRRTRRRVERILDGLAEAVTVATQDGKVVYANAAAARLMGAASVTEVLESSPGELAGRFVITLEDGSPVRPDDFPGTRLLAGLEAPPLLTRSVLRATGQELWLLTKATVLDEEDERLAVSIIEDVTEAKLAERRARFLAHAGEVLAASLDPEDTLRGIAGLVVPHLADWCAIDLVDEDAAVPRRVAVAHADPERLAFAEELQRRFPPYQDGVSPEMQQVIDGGPPILVPEITDEMLASADRDPEELRLLLEVGMRSAIVLPLRAGDRTTGLLTMINAESGRAFDGTDLAFAEDIARRAAVAVENARRFAERG